MATHPLGDYSVETFLKDYWQKRPLVIRNALPGLKSPVSAEELAGLACEEGIESRIVLEEEDGVPWQLHNGPFDEDYFQSLPRGNWTLLVQGLDYWVPAVADLLEPFRFIPNWRVDDIMASYAPIGGSVGPHFDQYDVFLLQAEGQRRWKIGPVCDQNSERVTNTPLHILAKFEEEEEYVLDPGDMLYLPPGVSHWGIADNDCITLSVGFRTPNEAEVLTGFSDFLVHQLPLERHLADPAPHPLDNPGRIDHAIIDELERIVTSATQRRDLLAGWFGQAMTEPKHSGIVEAPEEPLATETVRQMVANGHDLSWNEGSRFAFYDVGDEERLLFVDGDRYVLRGEARGLATLLCAGRQVPASELSQWLDEDALAELVTYLINQGSLYDPSETDEE